MILSRILLILFLLCGSSWVIASKDNQPILRVANWSNYIPLDDSVLDSEPWSKRAPQLGAFEKQCGCQVDYQEYEGTQELLLKVEQIPDYYDVIIVSNGDVERLKKSRLLIELDHAKLPTFDSNNYTIRNDGDPNWSFLIPYLYGTTGIAYRADLVKKEITSWQEFFYPEAYLKGKVSLPADDYINFAFVLLLSGHEPMSNVIEEVHQAARHIYNLKNNGFIAKITSNVEQQQQDLIDGRIAMSIMYSGDALTAIAANNKIKYVIPKEGGEFYIDGFAITQASAQKELAYQFINYMIDVDQQVAASAYLLYPTPNKKAIKVLRQKHPELLSNPAIYPPKAVLGNLHIIGNNSAAVRSFWNRIFN